MLSSYTYLLIDLLALSFPLAASWDKRFSFHKKFKAIFIGIFSMMLVFIPWDIWFTSKGVWGFNPDYLTGFKILNLPIEEWLFFICIPFSSLFIFECVKYYFPNQLQSVKWAKLVSGSLSVILFGLALINYEKAYTFYNFLGCSILLLANIIKPSKYLLTFLMSYLFVLIPFFIVNGILTGSFLEAPIVWYNNSENLGIRLFTIPIEDTVYGLFMLLLTFNVYQWRLKKI